MTDKPVIGARALARKLKMDNTTCMKWLPIECKAVGTGSRGEALYDEAEATAVMERHRGKHSSHKPENPAPVKGKGAMFDPETGLSWPALYEKEKAVELRRKNREEDARVKREWIPADKVKEMFSAFTQSLEQLPGKLSSELGLSPTQTLAIRRGLDEARQNASAKILET